MCNLPEVTGYGTFQSTPSLRRATASMSSAEGCLGFQSTPSLRRATAHHTRGVVGRTVSIHALLAESDRKGVVLAVDVGLFQSTPSLRRATGCHLPGKLLLMFQSTPSLRRATGKEHFVYCVLEFQSTPSLRRATSNPPRLKPSRKVSIHALLAESDIRGRGHGFINYCFNPRPPCGERPLTSIIPHHPGQFQSTPSLRRATDYRLQGLWFFDVSIHALLAESDRFWK